MRRVYEITTYDGREYTTVSTLFFSAARAEQELINHMVYHWGSAVTYDRIANADSSFVQYKAYSDDPYSVCEAWFRTRILNMAEA